MKNFYKVDPRVIDKLKALEAHCDLYKKIARTRSRVQEAKQYMANRLMIELVINKG